MWPGIQAAPTESVSEFRRRPIEGQPWTVLPQHFQVVTDVGAVQTVTGGPWLRLSLLVTRWP